MTCALIIVLLGVSNTVYAFGVSKSSTSKDGDQPSKKVKRWAPGFQDIAVDYPDFDDPYGENQLEVARPFSARTPICIRRDLGCCACNPGCSHSKNTCSYCKTGTCPEIANENSTRRKPRFSVPGSVLYYRSSSSRPSGAVTRTIFNPPSGFIPRIFAAAKAAIATLTGPQTVLSRTTYLAPPRPGITAFQIPHGPQVVEGGTSASNAAAAAAAAAAVAAVTRSIYEAAGQRGIEKGTYLPPSTYSNYGVWPEPHTSPWTTLQPPHISFRVPHESWDRPRPHISDTYGAPSPTWLNPNPVISIEAPRNPWMENHFNKDAHNGWNQWQSFNRNQGSWAQENRIKDWIDEKRMKSVSGRAGGNGGYAAATVDTPPNGESFADAKITANGASAVAAAVWDLGGPSGRVTERKKTEEYGVREELAKDEEKTRMQREEQYEDSRFNGRIGADLDIKKLDEGKCDDDHGCLAKTNAGRLRKLFPNRRKP